MVVFVLTPACKRSVGIRVLAFDRAPGMPDTATSDALRLRYCPAVSVWLAIAPSDLFHDGNCPVVFPGTLP